MVRWTGLAPWEFEFPFPGSLTSTFLALFPTLAVRLRPSLGIRLLQSPAQEATRPEYCRREFASGISPREIGVTTGVPYSYENAPP